MDEPIVLEAPRLRWLLYSVGALLVAGFAASIASALDPAWPSPFLALPGAIAVIAGAMALMARRPGQLRIASDGFSYNAPLSSASYRWSDVLRFGVYLGVGGEKVGFDFAPDYTGPRQLRLAADARGGFAASLPSTYGREPRALADLLERRRIAAREPASPR
ncbi:MAG TPA: hypothetical protein VJQ09_07340 [Candidatus Limnocylindria bacterium]|nr:hypothetical protein [Candidatus Limnocylindria bacterium]